MNIPRHSAQQAGTRIAVINHTSFVIIKTDWQLEENINYYLSRTFSFLESPQVTKGIFLMPVSDLLTQIIEIHFLSSIFLIGAKG